MSNDNFNGGFKTFATPVLLVVLWWLAVVGAMIFGGVSMYGLSQQHAAAMKKYDDMPDWQKERVEKPTPPAIPFLIGTVGTIAALLVVRIFLESIAVLFRIENHQKTTRLTFERFEKMSKMQ